MKTYRERQEEVRQEAIEWQLRASEENYSWQELSEFADYFHRLGKRYGLLREFEENCIPC
jgi:ferric-dicitrate binding protein FerR (iron transport regulator)